MLYLVCFVAVVIALLWVFQIVLLDDFYRMHKSRQVSGTAELVLQNLSSDDLSGLAERLASQNDVNLMIVDGEGEEYLSAEGSRNSLLHRMDSGTRAYWCAQAPEDGSAKETFFRTDAAMYVMSGEMPDWMRGEAGETPPAPPSVSPGEEMIRPTGEGTVPPPRGAGEERRDEEWRETSRKRLRELSLESSDVLSLLYVRRIELPEGGEGTLLINTQISPVSSTVSALREQLLVITGVVLVLAVALAMLISHRVSTPIIQTNEAAKALSRAQYQKPKGASGYREIAELNETLEKAAQELGQVENLQHELIANISHDLRTPLTMIGGYAEAMRDIPDENNPENMQIIIDETARLSTLVNELLDFSRMQTGSVQMRCAPFDLTESVQSTVSRISSMVAKDGYTVRFSPDRHVTVLADETRIGQVLYNLIGNALTYTGEDKTVTVTQRQTGERARIEITDTGKGIAPDEVKLIWNRYYRTKETHRRAIIGSGLGLNIVQTILEQHHTPYGVDSRVGEGTTFWFELTVAEGPRSIEGGN